MSKPTDWPKSRYWLACVATLFAAIAAPAVAQQNNQTPSQPNPPMFKEPLTTANLFPRGKKKVVQAQAQPSQPPLGQPAQAGDPSMIHAPPPAPAPFKKRFFDKLDTNNDGIVSRDEFLAQANRQFNALDLNHDGRLTSDEISAAVVKAEAKGDAAAVPPKANDNMMDNADAGGRKRKYRDN